MGLDKLDDSMNNVGFGVTNSLVNQIPRLNSFGISMVCIDFVRYGENPPHMYAPTCSRDTNGSLHLQ